LVEFHIALDPKSKKNYSASNFSSQMPQLRELQIYQKRESSSQIHQIHRAPQGVLFHGVGENYPSMPSITHILVRFFLSVSRVRLPPVFARLASTRMPSQRVGTLPNDFMGGQLHRIAAPWWSTSSEAMF
jgi:hypothetical protein